MAVPEVASSLEQARSAWNLSFFGDLPEPLNSQLFEASWVEDAEAGTTVMRGMEASSFVVVDGLVRVYLRGHETRQVTIRYGSQSDVIGLPPVVLEQMPVWADAVTDVRIVRIPTERIRALAQREVVLAWAIARHLAQQMASTNDTLAADVFLSVRSRVARHLLDLAEREPEGLVVRARHQHIANAIGSVREVVSREMKRFADEGLVSRVRGGTLLLDSAELHRISSG